MKSLGFFAIGAVVGALISGILLRANFSRSIPEPNISTAHLQATPVTCEKEICPSDCKLLAPPEFSESLTNPILTNREGELVVKWKPRDGAIGYRIFLEDRNQNTMRSWHAKKTMIYLKEIPLPADPEGLNYRVRLASLNRYGVEGEKGEPREVVVKPQVKLVAPKVREIRVED